jgi:lipopolysaccharide/colanic/teichoic acid biosynthesis glycosyltransferase
MKGKPIKVYKMRTMHPYSEYLQAYIHDKNNLKAGGKFYKDIRITSIGHIMRKYWIDELPMFLNLFKGEMKLVGVRPLSVHYFNLYSKELQEKRIKHKPGLLPPFYADLPQTLDEIQESEMKYLLACEEKGVFITDIRYLFLIIKNIVFNKARSE